MSAVQGFDRYRMSGSDEEGDYTLDIDSVTLEDDALFQCQVGAAAGVAPVRQLSCLSHPAYSMMGRDESESLNTSGFSAPVQSKIRVS